MQSQYHALQVHRAVKRLYINEFLNSNRNKCRLKSVFCIGTEKAVLYCTVAASVTLPEVALSKSAMQRLSYDILYRRHVISTIDCSLQRNIELPNTIEMSTLIYSVVKSMKIRSLSTIEISIEIEKLNTIVE